MNRKYAPYIVILGVLAAYAIYAAQDAAHRGNGMAAIVMLAIAAIFWKATQRARR